MRPEDALQRRAYYPTFNRGLKAFDWVSIGPNVLANSSRVNVKARGVRVSI